MRNDPQPPFGPFDTLGTIGIGWWLRVRCACERTTDFPVALLIRCGGCGARPDSADYIDHPAGGAKGTDYPPPRRMPRWRVSNGVGLTDLAAPLAYAILIAAGGNVPSSSDPPVAYASGACGSR